MWLFNYETLIDPILKDVRSHAPRFAGMTAGDRVLDVCCGTGAQVLEYGRRGIIATGIDINASTLQVGVRLAAKQKMENVSFQLADATNLPFPDGSFDFASISFALHDKEQSVRYKIIAEMKRVVKQDGAFLLIDFRVPLPGNIWGLLARTIEFIAGGAHYRGFRSYLATGGIAPILKNSGLQAASGINLKAGLVVMTKALRS